MKTIQIEYSSDNSLARFLSVKAAHFCTLVWFTM